MLTTPLEIAANLRQLLESHDPLIISFHERSQRFQSYVVHIDRDTGVLALDEMIPRDGEKYIENGEAFRVEGFHDGVRIAWECDTPLTITEIDGHRCYRGPLPTEVTYHQRRSAFRAALKLSQLVDIILDGTHLKGNGALRGKLLDISATGCKLRFEGNVEERLQLGQVYERFKAANPWAWPTPWSNCATCTSKSASTPPSPAYASTTSTARHSARSRVSCISCSAKHDASTKTTTDQPPDMQTPPIGWRFCLQRSDRPKKGSAATT